MIIEWLVKVAVGFWQFLADMFPDWELPPELLDADGMIAQVFSFGQGLEPFVNWPLVGALGLIPLAVWVIGLTVRMVRLLLSHVPFIGGNG